MRIRLRPGLAADRALVYDSFLRHQASAAGLRFDQVATGGRRLLDRVLNKPGVQVRCAVDADDAGKILGLAVFDLPKSVLWWVYVKKGSRGWGVCRALLDGLPPMRAPWLERAAWIVARSVELRYEPLAALEV